MAERKVDIQEQEPSPIDQNQKLIGIFLQIPTDELIFRKRAERLLADALGQPEEHLEDENLMERIKGWLDDPEFWKMLSEAKSRSEIRRRSDEKRRLIEELRQLLGEAKITDRFKETIISRYSTDYAIGASLGSMNLRPTWFIITSEMILDLDHPKSGGIFEPDRSKYIEALYFREINEKFTQIAQEHHQKGVHDFANIHEQEIIKYRRIFTRYHKHSPESLLTKQV